MRRKTAIIIAVLGAVAVGAVVATAVVLRRRQAAPGPVDGGQQPPGETIIQPTQETPPLEFGAPDESDADGDGLDAALEATRGTDPSDDDTDGDGLTDGQEHFTTKTDPTKPDTDGDGVTDGTQYFRTTLRPAPR